MILQKYYCIAYPILMLKEKFHGHLMLNSPNKNNKSIKNKQKIIKRYFPEWISH